MLARAHQAYVSAFLAKIALSTSTPFERSGKVEDEDIVHWVVFYRHTPAINRRVTSKKRLQSQLKKIVFAKVSDRSLN